VPAPGEGDGNNTDFWAGFEESIKGKTWDPF
jgi:hypothetical protein